MNKPTPINEILEKLPEKWLRYPQGDTEYSSTRGDGYDQCLEEVKKLLEDMKDE